MLSFFSKIAESPAFITFNAHCWSAAFLVTIGLPWWIAIAAAAVKEFYVDVRYENDPSQTYADGAKDFAGYAAGVGIALVVAYLRTHI